MRRNVGAAVAIIVLSAVTAFAAVQMMSVQVRDGQLRSTPSFLGKVVGPVAYGDRVQVNNTQGDWLNVTAPGGKSGWIHTSALTKKKIVMTAGSGDVQTGASGDELALASKGFNSDVEAEFKQGNKNIDFTWVDKMEKIKVSPEQMREFLAAGGVEPKGATP